MQLDTNTGFAILVYRLTCPSPRDMLVNFISIEVANLKNKCISMCKHYKHVLAFEMNEQHFCKHTAVHSLYEWCQSVSSGT